MCITTILFLMSKTTMIVFHINDKYSIGFHQCFGSPELYYQQSAGSAYECFARRKKIINKEAIVDILIMGITTELVHVVPNGDYIDKWKSNLSMEDFLNAKVDKIDIVHENYNIKHYLPHPQVNLDTSSTQEYYNIYKSSICDISTNEIHNVKCLVWKAMKDEERAERNKRFEN